MRIALSRVSCKRWKNYYKSLIFSVNMNTLVAGKSTVKRPHQSISSADYNMAAVSDSKSHVSSDSSDSETNQVLTSKSQRSSEQKKMGRILANRKSARKSRERRKNLIVDLESSVVYLTKQNDGLRQQNDDLNSQVTLLTSLLNQRNNQFIAAGASNSLGGANLSQINSQLVMGGTTNALSGTPSAPLSPAISTDTIGVLQAIANMRNVQGSTPNIDIVAALLNPSLRSAVTRQDQTPAIHLPTHGNRWCGTTILSST